MDIEKLHTEIVEEYHDLVRIYCTCKLLNEEDAKECTQEVFVLLMLKNINFTMNIKVWLFNTADKVLKNYKCKNNRHISVTDMEFIPNLSDYYTNIAVENRIQSFLAEEDYNLVWDFFVNRVPIEKLAKERSISLINCYSRISRLQQDVFE